MMLRNGKRIGEEETKKTKEGVEQTNKEAAAKETTATSTSAIQTQINALQAAAAEKYNAVRNIDKEQAKQMASDAASRAKDAAEHVRNLPNKTTSNADMSHAALVYSLFVAGREALLDCSGWLRTISHVVDAGAAGVFALSFANQSGYLDKPMGFFSRILNSAQTQDAPEQKVEQEASTAPAPGK